MPLTLPDGREEVTFGSPAERVEIASTGVAARTVRGRSGAAAACASTSPHGPTPSLPSEIAEGHAAKLLNMRTTLLTLAGGDLHEHVRHGLGAERRSPQPRAGPLAPGPAAQAGLAFARTMDWDRINSAVFAVYGRVIERRRRYGRLTGR